MKIELLCWHWIGWILNVCMCACAAATWLSSADTDQDGKVRVENFEHFLQEQVFILNTHLESQGEQPVFAMENLMAQVSQPAGRYQQQHVAHDNVKILRCGGVV